MPEETDRRPKPADSLTALGQVTGELVHDLANEVQVLQGWAMLARGEAVTGAAPVNELQRVVDISSRLGRMLRDMLETVSGQTTSPELVFDPHALTEATVNERVREMASLDVHFRSYLPEAMRVAGRASFWSRVVSNLLINASRYAFLTIRVTLAQRVDSDDRKWIVLRVEDDGPGVSASEQSEIFQPLWRGERGGAGLGLSSVAWSVSELRGTVRYASDSTIGGAAFEVCVPAAGPLQFPPEPHTETPGALRGVRLLLIDEIMLADPQVILLDVHLGDRGGIALWRRLAEEEPEMAARVAFVTGLVAGDPTWDEADGTGQPVLGKPFDMPELLQTLTRLRMPG